MRPLSRPFGNPFLLDAREATMTKSKTGMSVAGVLVLLVIGGFFAIAANQYVYAAALSAPVGFPHQRDCAKWAMGTHHSSVGQSTGTTEIAASGLLASDYVYSIVNLSDPSETQIAPSAITAAADKITFASGSTNAEYYMVLWKRLGSAGR